VVEPGFENVRDFTARSGAPEPVALRMRNVRGVLTEEQVVHGTDVVESPGVLAVRSVIVRGKRLHQKWVPSSLGGEAPQAYRMLEAEVRALVRLAQVYGPRMPPGLPMIRGYNVDVDEPFLLIEPQDGAPASQLVRELEDDLERRRFVDGLLTVLSLCKGADVTHRGLTLDSVHWDGATVELTCFEHALLRSREGAADDVMAVGNIIRQIYLGRQPAQTFQREPEHLTQELRNVFATDRAGRPPLAELMRRYHVTAPAVDRNDPEEPFAAGKAAFETACRVKLGHHVVGPPPARHVGAPPTGPAHQPQHRRSGEGPTQPVPMPPSSGSRTSRAGVWLAVVAVLAVVVAVLALTGVLP
jgi:hypothetical protein